MLLQRTAEEREKAGETEEVVNLTFEVGTKVWHTPGLRLPFLRSGGLKLGNLFDTSVQLPLESAVRELYLWMGALVGDATTLHHPGLGT